MSAPITFLGPRGTFAEAALNALLGADAGPREPSATVQAALAAVRDGSARSALVPIENSVEGSVSVTLDELAAGEPLMIVDEVTIPVQFALLVRPGTTIDDIKRIATHPHAQAQTRGWVDTNIPTATVIPATSTAGAAEVLASFEEGALAYEAAISQPIAGEIYGLEALFDQIADNQEASTRFVLVTKPGPPPAATGADKTTLVLFMHSDEPGALLEILTEFAVRGVNLTRIESRPTKKSLGDYCFSVDCEGHVADARVAEALMGLHRICSDVRFLGSYARHDGLSPVLRSGVTDSDFAEAADWIERVRSSGLT